MALSSYSYYLCILLRWQHKLIQDFFFHSYVSLTNSLAHFHSQILFLWQDLLSQVPVLVKGLFPEEDLKPLIRLKPASFSEKNPQHKSELVLQNYFAAENLTSWRVWNQQKWHSCMSSPYLSCRNTWCLLDETGVFSTARTAENGYARAKYLT